MKLTLITAYYDSGHYRDGLGKGPEAILASGIAGKLNASGHGIEIKDIGLVGESQGREIATGFAVCRAVAAVVGTACSEQRFPVVLTGNCLTAAGAVAGEQSKAIIWFDQHGDLNTPETSPYGFLDGMALATTLGLCWRPIAASIPGFEPVDPSRCVLVDARDLDADEIELLEDLPVAQVACEDLGKRLDDLFPTGKLRTHLHLDLDILDPDNIRVNRYATKGGPSPQTLGKALCDTARSLEISGLTISAYDPEFDPDNQVPMVVEHLLVDFLAAKEAIQ
ncbi:arginase family protein [Phyllobacteriaceae bacterium JZ32]